jgi:predicted nucleic acid-binding Zn ribbon protein
MSDTEPEDTPEGQPDDPMRDAATLEAHDPTGLGLARSIAHSVGSQVRRRKAAPRTKTEPQSSSSHPDDRDPQLLSTAMERLVETKGWSTDIDVHTLLGRWSVLVGPTNAAHSHPESYSDAVLTVRADSTVWATSLRSMAPQLVAILNDKLGDGTVSRVKVLGPDAPSWKKGRLSVRDGRGPRDTYG